MKETTIDYIDLQRIRPSKTNPRKHFDEDYIGELSDSIRTKGILQPLLARPDWCIGKTDDEIRVKSPNGDHAVNGGVAFYEIVAGECRFRGAVKANLEEAPAIVRLLSDRETLEIQLIENLQRSDLTAIEEAEAYRRLIDEMGYTVESIHEKTGKAIATIYGKLKMLKAPKVMLTAIEKDIVGERFGELVGRIPVPEAREQAAREILNPKILTETNFGTLQHLPDHPMTYREASAHVSTNYMRSLSKSDFDQAAAMLVVTLVDNETGERIGGGACTDCPMKSGNRPELLGDFKRADLCMNPKCFSQKTDAHFSRLQETAKAEGKKILTNEEARDIFEDDNRLWFDSPYVKLSDKPDDAEVYGVFVGGPPSWRKLLENVESKPQIVIARDPRGRVVELVDRALAIEAIKLAAKQKGEKSIFDLQQQRSAGSRSASSGDTSPTYQEQERKKRETAKLNFKVTLAVMTELIGAIDKQGVVNGFWDALIEASITHAGHDGAWLICKRLGLDPKNHVKAEAAHVAPGVESAALEFGLTLPDDKFKLGFVVELLLSQRVKFSGNSGGLKSVEVLKNFIELYKIDMAAIERDVKAANRTGGKKKEKNESGSQEAKNLSGGVSRKASPRDIKRLYEEPIRKNKLVDAEVESPPAQKIAKHKWENITGNKFHCRNCPAAAVKNVKGEIVPMNEFRGKPCAGVSEDKPRKPRKPRKALPRGEASPRGKCSHCSNRAAPNKSMCPKCLTKNAARVKARRAGKGGVKK